MNIKKRTSTAISLASILGGVADVLLARETGGLGHIFQTPRQREIGKKARDQNVSRETQEDLIAKAEAKRQRKNEKRAWDSAECKAGYHPLLNKGFKQWLAGLAKVEEAKVEEARIAHGEDLSS